MKTADPELMRAINRFHVLDTIRRAGAISRVEIGEYTQLSATTISAITGALIEDELITPHHEGDLRSSGTGRGRPRVKLTLNAGAARVVGAKIATNGLAFVVSDFEGQPLAELKLPLRADRLALAVLADLVEDGVRRCVHDAGLTLGEINSVALALPGVIEHGSGRVRSSPIFRDTDVQLTETIGQRLGVPTIAESDANAVALGEHWFGRARDCDDFLVVAVENGLGLAVMHGGQLFRGARELSLDLGQMMLGGQNGSYHRLLDLAGDDAILCGGQGDIRLREAVHLGRPMTHVRRLIEQGNPDLAQAVHRAGEALGIAIANLVGLFAPPRVILAGANLALGPHLLDPLRTSFDRSVTPSLREISEIIIDEAGDELWARGAAAVALGELYGSPWGSTGPALRTMTGLARAGE